MAGRTPILTLLAVGLVACSMVPGASAENISSSPLLQVNYIQSTAGGFVPAVYGYCLDPAVCSGVSDDSGCRVVEPYGTSPAISTDPLLGLVVVDPDGCFVPITDGGIALPGPRPGQSMFMEAN